MMETNIAQHTSNDNKILDDGYFKAQQELLRESLLTDPSGAMYVVDELANAVHEGISFSVSQDGQIAIGGTISLLGKVGAKEVHFHGFSMDASDGNYTVHLYEAPTTTVDGTPVTAYNRKRASTNVNTMTVYGGPTVTAVGTILEHSHVYSTGSQGSHLSGGTGTLGADWVLRPNTNYLIQIANLSGAILNYTAKFIWAER